MPVPIGEGLPALLAAFETAPPVPAIDIVRVFARRAIVNNHRVWGDVNLTRLLSDWLLPTDRDALNHMAHSVPVSSP